jgi:[acyl-carrier-protein] S-malonyltransferase
MRCAFVFPGQGSQSVGMGRALAEAFPAARHVFNEVDDALRFRLSRVIFEGEHADLQLTANAQPALMAVSLATVRVLERETGIAVADKAAFVAGHSLGEYSALAAAGALSIADTARLLKQRGQAMQEAVPVGQGAMAALLGLDLAAARAVAAEAAQDDVCATANDNADGQVVLSGDTAAVERAVALAPAKGAKRAIMLSVSAPFHCALMAPAAAVMADALAKVLMRPPRPPLVANVSAEATDDPETIRQLLVQQVTAMVRWRESVLYMRDHGVDTLIELGAGKVLTGLTRRIDRDLSALAAGTPDEIEVLVKSL